jgi:phosphoribosyl 1,2-cyclic phosphodiesterase
MGNDFQVCVLGSGSKGNCTYVKAGRAECLVDIGLNYREVERRLGEISVLPSRIQHLFITHEHTDHVNGLQSFIKKNAVHLHMNAKTYLQVQARLPKNYPVNLFDSAIEIDDIHIRPFAVSHDAVDPVGFTFKYHQKQLCIATDMGYVSKLVMEEFKHCDGLILETNHDENKLMHGRYPWPLKQRIASRFGHLSNRQAAEALCDTVHDRLKYVFLAHLSEENNSPEMALDCVRYHLSETIAISPTLLMTHPHRNSEIVYL